MHECAHAPGRQRTSTLEEFFGEDTGFFELQSQIQLAQRQYAQGGGWGEGGSGDQASGQEGNTSPDMQASQQGKCCPSNSQYLKISHLVSGQRGLVVLKRPASERGGYIACSFHGSAA